MHKLVRDDFDPARCRLHGDFEADSARIRRAAALVGAATSAAALALAAPSSAFAGSAEQPKRPSDARAGSPGAGARAAPPRPRARPAARLWSQYPAGSATLRTAPTPETTARSTRSARSILRPRPRPAASGAASSKQPAAPGIDERPWLLGAGVGIGLVLGLLMLLLLLLAGLRARPATPKRRPEGRPRPASSPPPATPKPADPAPAPRRSAQPPPPPAPPGARDVPRASDPTPASQNGDANGATHLVLLPTADGYSLIQGEGAAPVPGTVVEGAELSVEGRFVVSRVGPSPLPLDPRRCVYLERSDA